MDIESLVDEDLGILVRELGTVEDLREIRDAAHRIEDEAEAEIAHRKANPERYDWDPAVEEDND